MEDLFVHREDNPFYEVDTPSFKDLQMKMLHVYQDDKAGSDDYNSDDDKKMPAKPSMKKK